MKQRVSVRAVIKREGKILLLRRSDGKPSLQNKYELAGGSVAYGEQPDDAVRRYVHEQVGVEISTLQLKDTLGYINDEFDTTQDIVIIFVASISEGKRIHLSKKYDRYDWIEEQKIQHNEVTELTSMILGQEIVVTQTPSIESDEEKTTDDTMIVYSDGGSRGNPGPSATGYVVLNTSNEVLAEGGNYLGITTNNQAEYQAVLAGLHKAKELGAKRIDFRVDSMLVVNQMKGIYKVKNRDLWPIYERIKEMIASFDRVSFTHVKREFNVHADSMVNKILDAHGAS